MYIQQSPIFDIATTSVLLELTDFFPPMPTSLFFGDSSVILFSLYCTSLYLHMQFSLTVIHNDIYVHNKVSTSHLRTAKPPFIGCGSRTYLEKPKVLYALYKIGL